MVDNDQGSSETYIDLHRRRFLLGMASSPFAGAALSSEAGAASNREITVSQDGTEAATVVPYSHGMNVDRFYSYNGEYRGNQNSSANTPSDVELEQSGVSQLFFHEHNGILSLVTIHDEPGANSGSHRMEFDGLPDSGSWAVKDDPKHRPDEYPSDGSFAEWGWGSCCTDGGAYSWPDVGDVEFTVTPAAHNSRSNSPFDGLHTWKLRSGDGNSAELDKSKSITVSVGQGSQPGDEFATLVEEKTRLIEAIRDGAAEPITTLDDGKTTVSGLDRTEIDAAADGYLDELESDFDGATKERKETLLESADRLVDAETITVTATTRSKEVLWEMSRTGAAIALSIAIGFVSSGGRAVLSSGRRGLLADQTRTVVNQLRSMQTAVLGLDSLPASERREFETLIEDHSDELATQFVDDHGNSMHSSVKGNLATLAGASSFGDIVEALFDALAPEVIDQFTNFTDQLAKVIFQEQYRRFFDDENTKSDDLREFTGASPTLRCGHTDIFGPTSAADTLDGINNQINDQVDALSTRAGGGELSSEGADQRDKIASELSSCINSEAEASASTLADLDQIASAIGFISLMLAIATLVYVAIAVITSPEPISSIVSGVIAGVLLEATAITGAAATILSGLAMLWGIRYLDFALLVHARGTAGIVDYEVYFQ